MFTFAELMDVLLLITFLFYLVFLQEIVHYLIEKQNIGKILRLLKQSKRTGSFSTEENKKCRQKILISLSPSKQLILSVLGLNRHAQY